MRHFPADPVAYGQGKWWVYSATRDMWKWWWCAGFAWGGQGGADCDITDRGERKYHLLLRFDETDVVAGYGVVEEEECAANLACFERGSVIVLEDAIADEAAKAFRDVPGRCGLYIYSTAKWTAPVELDNEPVGALLDTKVFYYRIVPHGEHQVLVGSGSLAVQCGQTPLIFAEYREQGASTELRLVRESTGRNAVGKRHLALQTLSKQAVVRQRINDADKEYQPLWEN